MLQVNTNENKLKILWRKIKMKLYCWQCSECKRFLHYYDIELLKTHIRIHKERCGRPYGDIIDKSVAELVWVNDTGVVKEGSNG